MSLTIGRVPAGILATTGCVAVALLVGVQFEPQFFGTWFATVAMAAIPLQIIVALVWKVGYPAAIARFAQPLRGLAVLVMLAASAVVITGATLALVGGSVTPPTPFTILFMILFIICTMWTVIVFQCWPVSALTSHPGVLGVGALLQSYVLGLVIHRLLSFGVFEGAPFYSVDLDPAGPFEAWYAMAFVLTTAAVMLGWVLLDFWPISALAAQRPNWSRQPYFGLLVGLVVLVISSALYGAFVTTLGMDPVDYLVRVPASLIFGEFIILVLFRAGRYRPTVQPGGGALLLLLVVGLAIALYALYRWVALLLVGPLESGPPAYALELWIATAMLALTFPLIVAYGDCFDYWPLRIAPPDAANDSEALQSGGKAL